MASGNDYDAQLREVTAAGASTEDAYWDLVTTDIEHAADILRPLYDRLGAADGFVSVEVSPDLAHDTAATIRQAKELWERLDRPNVMIKIPATLEGLPAITETLAAGHQRQRHADLQPRAVPAGDRRVPRGPRAARSRRAAISAALASVASFFVSRVDTETDRRLPEGHALRGKAAVANAKLAYQHVPRRVRRRAVGRARRGGRARAAAAVGVDLDEEPGVLPHALRRRADRHATP